MKKLILILLIILSACSTNNSDLPLPELADGIRGSQLGIDKNINEETIDDYLGRTDAVYRDMRMLKDEANYEAIGGDSYLSGYVKGFEVVPYPYLCNVTGLPEEVGSSYSGATLYTLNDDGSYDVNYEESLSIIEEYFPRDKYIFLMCGGGGYAGMTKKLLVALGYDETRIYNVGGYWYYQGKHAIITTLANGEHDFSNVVYHYIDFDKLTPVEDYNPSEIKVSSRSSDTKIIKLNSYDELVDIQTSNSLFLLLISMDGCTSCATFKPIIKEYSLSSSIPIYEIEIGEVEKELGIQYTPTLIIYKGNEQIDSLDPMSNADITYYESIEQLDNWIETNIK